MQTGAVTQDQIREMANKVWESLNTDSGKLDYDAWRAEYGIDTDAEFNAAKAQLEYEMATWRENYGANAERLAQMGLSNSGVVDIYGTGVIQAYAQSMNDLFLAKIDAENAQLDRYKAYSDEYENKKAQATEAKNTAINQAYAYGLGIYNGDNLEAVRTMIANAGYAPDEVEAAVARLQAVDPSMIPALQEQAAADKQNVQAAFNSLAANYTPEQDDGLRKLYGEGMGWSEESVNSLISMLNGYAETKSVAMPSDDHTVARQLFADSVSEYNPDNRDNLAEVWKGLGIDPGEIEFALDILDNAYSTSIQSQVNKTLENINGFELGGLSSQTVANTLSEAAIAFGKNSEAYKTISAALEQKLGKEYAHALGHTEADNYEYVLMNSYALAGYADTNGKPTEEWENMDNAERVDAIMDSAIQMYNNKFLSEETLMTVIDDDIATEMRIIRRNIPEVVTSGYSTGNVIQKLIEYADIAATYLEKRNKGEIPDSVYLKALDYIYDQLKENEKELLDNDAKYYKNYGLNTDARIEAYNDIQTRANKKAVKGAFKP
jgi:hypothetical protein